MKAINFYTANGWAGSNYDSKLSTKEIAANVRAYAKKNFPEFKFSVRSEWSMYADSMYIELKSGPCVPFVEGSRSAKLGYMSTMSTVKGWENELTPEMFKVLDAVTTYASSFRYNDSDGMQDYFDTNFYIHIEVSDEYKVIEPKAKKSSIKTEKAEEAKEMEAVTVEGLEMVDYSEKAIAVFGDTKAIKEQLKELGGRFNPSLNYNGEKRAGWIFSKKKADEVRNLMASEKVEAVEELPAPPEEIYIPELEEETKQPEKLGNIHLIETGNFNGVRYYNIEGAGIITSAKVREGIQPGDVFNVYTAEDRKYGVTYDGVSLESSLKNDLPGIIEFNGKIESGTLSASSHYTPLAEGVEFYEKEVKGKRYTVKDKPLNLGYYGILDNLDNCIIECYPTKEEAEKEAEILNGFTDGNGRLKTVI
ncbi:hypothetical protein HMPREF0105_2807 [Bacteroides sp. 3_1_33FAA]|nr:hypothetical protein HMPREF0105_2807 [Bacteroides sp. 3_1_33FAA]